MDRTANLLHAMATAVADYQRHVLTEAQGLSPSAIAVLMTLGQYESQSVSELAAVTALSHSATVRLLDRLEQDELIKRASVKKGRSVPISLTSVGRRTYADLRNKQSRALNELLGSLSQEDKGSLTRLAERLLGYMALSDRAGDHICRFCDESVCVQSECPVAFASQERSP